MAESGLKRAVIKIDDDDVDALVQKNTDHTFNFTITAPERYYEKNETPMSAAAVGSGKIYTAIIYLHDWEDIMEMGVN